MTIQIEKAVPSQEVSNEKSNKTKKRRSSLVVRPLGRFLSIGSLPEKQKKKKSYIQKRTEMKETKDRKTKVAKSLSNAVVVDSKSVVIEPPEKKSPKKTKKEDKKKKKKSKKKTSKSKDKKQKQKRKKVKFDSLSDGESDNDEEKAQKARLSFKNTMVAVGPEVPQFELALHAAMSPDNFKPTFLSRRPSFDVSPSKAQSLKQERAKKKSKKKGPSSGTCCDPSLEQKENRTSRRTSKKEGCKGTSVVAEKSKVRPSKLRTRKSKELKATTKTETPHIDSPALEKGSNINDLSTLPRNDLLTLIPGDKGGDLYSIPQSNRSLDLDSLCIRKHAFDSSKLSSSRGSLATASTQPETICEDSILDLSMGSTYLDTPQQSRKVIFTTTSSPMGLLPPSSANVEPTKTGLHSQSCSKPSGTSSLPPRYVKQSPSTTQNHPTCLPRPQRLQSDLHDWRKEASSSKNQSSRDKKQSQVKDVNRQAKRRPGVLHHSTPTSSFKALVRQALDQQEMIMLETPARGH